MRPPSPELVSKLANYLLYPALDTGPSIQASVRRLNASIRREVDIDDSLFVERCRDLLPTMHLITHASRAKANTASSSTGVQRPDLVPLLLAGDIHAIATTARDLGLGHEVMPLDSAEVCGLVLTPRPNSSLAVQRALAPAQTLLMALLLIDSNTEAAVATVVDLLGVELDLHSRRAAEYPLLSLAYDVFRDQWNNDRYRMLGACIHAMAGLLFEAPSTTPAWPTMTEGVFQWGDGERIFRQSQRRMLELLVEHESGMTQEQFWGYGLKSVAPTVSRIRTALVDAMCPWTIDLVYDTYRLTRHWGYLRRFPTTTSLSPFSNPPLSHPGARAILSRTRVS